MQELWRDVWYDNRRIEGYKVSNKGRIWSCRYKKVMKPNTDRYGYKYINFAVDGKYKSFKIHRLVAQNFLHFIVEPGKEIKEYTVNHKDENKKNNSVDNLEFITIKANINYGSANKRRGQTMSGDKHPMYGSARKGKTILCIETGKIYHSTREAARAVGVKSSNNIAKCCNGKRNICGGYHWRYL